MVQKWKKIKIEKKLNIFLDKALKFWYSTCIETKQYRGVEQLAARRAHNPKVVGSNPPPATK